MITKTIFAGEHAALDSNVYTGGGTDDTAALQAILDKATEWGGLRLIMDGAALISGLRIHSNTTIECLNKDCGFYQKGGSNKAVVENFDRNFDVIKNRNISLLGGTYNQNCREQEHHIAGIDPIWNEKIKEVNALENSTLVFAMQFTGVENLLLRDVTIRNQRTWAMHVSNWKQVVMENIIIDLPEKMHGQNQDGLHFWGPGQFLTLRNISGDVGDDFIALAPDEHDRVSDITDVLIDGVFLDHADQGIRLLSRGKGLLDRVTIRNVSGTYRSFGFYITPWFPDDVCGNYGDILFENIDLQPEVPNYDYRAPFLFQIGGHVRHLTLRNIRDHYSENQRALFEIGWPFKRRNIEKTETFIDELTVDGFSVLRKDGFSISPFIVDGKIDRMILRNIDISCKETSDTPLIAFRPNGHIGTLAVNGLISNGLRKIADIPDGAVEHEILWNIEPPELQHSN